jgi:hypothetical protein
VGEAAAAGHLGGALLGQRLEVVGRGQRAQPDAGAVGVGHSREVGRRLAGLGAGHGKRPADGEKRGSNQEATSEQANSHGPL